MRWRPSSLPELKPFAMKRQAERVKSFLDRFKTVEEFTPVISIDRRGKAWVKCQTPEGVVIEVPLHSLPLAPNRSDVRRMVRDVHRNAVRSHPFARARRRTFKGVMAQPVADRLMLHSIREAYPTSKDSDGSASPDLVCS